MTTVMKYETVLCKYCNIFHKQHTVKVITLAVSILTGTSSNRDLIKTFLTKNLKAVYMISKSFRHYQIYYSKYKNMKNSVLLYT